MALPFTSPTASVRKSTHSSTLKEMPVPQALRLSKLPSSGWILAFSLRLPFNVLKTCTCGISMTCLDLQYYPIMPDLISLTRVDATIISRTELLLFYIYLLYSFQCLAENYHIKYDQLLFIAPSNASFLYCPPSQTFHIYS